MTVAESERVDCLELRCRRLQKWLIVQSILFSVLLLTGAQQSRDSLLERLQAMEDRASTLENTATTLEVKVTANKDKFGKYTTTETYDKQRAELRQEIYKDLAAVLTDGEDMSEQKASDITPNHVDEWKREYFGNDEQHRKAIYAIKKFANDRGYKIGIMNGEAGRDSRGRGKYGVTFLFHLETLESIKAKAKENN